MPYIQPNILLTPTEKLIKPYECSFIVIEGPNLKGKLSLEGLEIKYDSYYLSQLTLNENAVDQPIMYGFLGENVTFLMIRARYMPLDPNWAIESEQYINYYFKDDPAQIRSMGQMLVLSGNSVKRIPQIYFNNPSINYKVYLEVLMANLPQQSLTNTQQYTQNASFGSLYWNSIISDIINYSSPTSTGSTELHILDADSNVVMVIPYNNIRTITKIDITTLMIGLDTEEKIKLQFLSAFNCDQANSRINWVLKSARHKTLTKILPTIDLTPPVITWNSNALTGTTTGITSGVTEAFLLLSGTTYTTSQLRDLLVTGATDLIDGLMDPTSVLLEVKPLYDLVPITGVTDIGTYELTFTVKDLANNLTTQIKYLSIYIDAYSSGYWDDNGVWNNISYWVD